MSMWHTIELKPGQKPPLPVLLVRYIKVFSIAVVLNAIVLASIFSTIDFIYAFSHVDIADNIFLGAFIGAIVILLTFIFGIPIASYLAKNNKLTMKYAMSICIFMAGVLIGLIYWMVVSEARPTTYVSAEFNRFWPGAISLIVCGFVYFKWIVIPKYKGEGA
jgi:drug/metabolite transporter (DMT)-like permease